MRPGEAFETRCYEYLKQIYRERSSKFYHEGGMDSTQSDIAVIKDGKIDFFIEAKDSLAQSGQFVLIPDETTETFIFSPRNRSKPNEMTNIIIEYMNRSFYKFNCAGTAGKALDMDTSVFSQWIIEHYKERNVKYVISYDGDYVIFPIRKFDSYFDISATYRIKKSGSTEPAKKDIKMVKQEIKNIYSSAVFTNEDKKLFVEITTPLTIDRFVLGKYTYYFSEQSPNVYEVRKLSNTYNMNVIFSIELIKTQDAGDLDEFESDI